MLSRKLCGARYGRRSWRVREIMSTPRSWRERPSEPGADPALGKSLAQIAGADLTFSGRRAGLALPRGRRTGAVGDRRRLLAAAGQHQDANYDRKGGQDSHLSDSFKSAKLVDRGAIFSYGGRPRVP